MKAIFPTAYFGSIRYYTELCRYVKVGIESWEHYPKQTLRNRCTILTANGLLNLSVPVVKSNGTKTLTKDVGISGEGKWRHEHWRAIQNAYEAAPYFDYYGMEVHDLIFSETKSLFELNRDISKRVLSWLDLETNITSTSEYIPITEKDYRANFPKPITILDKEQSPYTQVFGSTDTYSRDISILDAILCHGPLTRLIIKPN